MIEKFLTDLLKGVKRTKINKNKSVTAQSTDDDRWESRNERMNFKYTPGL